MTRLLMAVVLVLAGAVFYAPDAGAQLAINKYLELKRKQDWSAALKVIREEVAQPLLRTDVYLYSLRVIAIGALGDYVHFHGLDPAFDAEALGFYKEGLNYAGDDAKRQLQLSTVLGRYYSQTKRNGLALPYFRKNLAEWTKLDDKYQIVHSYDALASVYNDMGEIELRSRYRSLALEVARGYFQLGVSPKSEHEWLQYSAILGKAMGDAARPGNAAELEAIWALEEKVSERYLVPKSKAYLSASQHFAFAGELKRAAELADRARSLWAGERDRYPKDFQGGMEHDFGGARALLLLKEKKYAAALEEFDRVAEIRKSRGMLMNDVGFVIQRGEAYEGSNDLGAAIRTYRDGIALIETLRESVSVAERVAFFRSVARKVYWGLTRAYLGRYQKTGNVDDFFEALGASEQIRARQLGELLDPKGRSEISAERLKNLRERIAADEAVLCFVVTDSDVLLFALTREQQVGAVVPYDGPRLRAQVLQIARDLARPDSNAAQVNALLTELSRDLLGPVQSLLQGKQRLQVLPDGVLSALPFDLMSASGSEYRPLFRSHVVRLAPSLRFSAHVAGRGTSQGQQSLYALADPVYSKNPQVGGLASSELRTLTRGSRFLAYFEPLPETRAEVQGIAGLFAGGRVEAVLGEQATESGVKRADLAQFRYLHFATHGILGNDVPGIGEPALVLGAEPGEDGFLTATEVSALRLNADLTVLSACNTGSGEYFTGEGVMGMSRAFLAAGSRAVVVSLWPVASKATERLMLAFYRQLRAGRSAEDALQRAKLELIEDAGKTNPAEAHPFFWAPFVLLGG